MSGLDRRTEFRRDLKSLDKHARSPHRPFQSFESFNPLKPHELIDLDTSECRSAPRKAEDLRCLGGTAVVPS